MKTSQKLNFSIIALVLFCISFSSISQAQTDSDIVYLESEQFRAQIDALNLHNYSTNEYHLEVNLGDQMVDVIFVDNSVQEKKYG